MSQHPKGLFILFFTEMWERFSFYGMKAILTLFLVSEVNGGFGWGPDQALQLLGIYGFLAYATSVPGGILADRYLGQRRAVMLGGLLLCAGHGLMAFPAKTTFFIALVLIVCGVGLLKPNISTMVGGLYAKDDPKRQSGFTIFYMGINLGALLATLTVGYVGERIGWHFGFSLAGIGMLLGQAVFILGGKHLRGVGQAPQAHKVSVAAPKEPLTRPEWDRILLIVISLTAVLIFWTAFEQAAGLLTLYTSTYTDRTVGSIEIPASMFQSLNAFYILLLGPLVAGFWIWWTRRRGGVSALFKMGVGTVILGLGYVFMVGASMERADAVSGQSSVLWLLGAYLFHTVGELCLSPVALDFITRVAPKRIEATMMGLFWLVTGSGNYLAAQVGRLAGEQGEMVVFGGLVVACTLIGLPLALFAKRLSGLAHGTENLTEEANLVNSPVSKPEPAV